MSSPVYKSAMQARGMALKEWRTPTHWRMGRLTFEKLACSRANYDYVDLVRQTFLAMPIEFNPDFEAGIELIAGVVRKPNPFLGPPDGGVEMKTLKYDPAEGQPKAFPLELEVSA